MRIKKLIMAGFVVCVSSSVLMGCSTRESQTAQTTTEETKESKLCEAYQRIVDEYSSALQDIKDQKEEDLYEAYPDVAFDSFYDYIDDGNLDGKFYYTLYDLNKDGNDELVIGRHYEENEDGDISIIGLFAEHDGEAESLLAVEGLSSQSAFAFEIPVGISEYSGRYTIDMESADDGIYIYQIGEDGYTPVKEDKYTGNYSEDSDEENVTFTSEDGKTELTGDELNELVGLSPELDYTEIK